jgi:2'-5' RNA ligase
MGLAVLCASDLPAALIDLHDGMGRDLRQRHINVDAGPYQPHLTLAASSKACATGRLGANPVAC